MKTIYRILTFAAALLALPAFSFDTLTSTLNGGTANVTANTTNSYTTQAFFAPVYSSDIALAVSFVGSAAAVSNAVTLVFDTSLDNLEWNTAYFTLAVTPNGTSKVTRNVTQALGSIPYVRLSAIRNPNAGFLTNILLKATTKRGL